MKQLLCTLFLLIIINEQILTQDSQDILTPGKKNIVRMGGAGGFTPFLLFWKSSDINSAVNGVNTPTIPNQPVVLYGGQGYGYIMFIENFRVGGMGVSGGIGSSLISGTIRRDLDVSVSAGGVTLEYVFPLSERFDVVTGIMIGGGGINVKIRRDNYGLKTWNGLVNEWKADKEINNYRKDIDGSFYVFQPSINCEYAILRWISLRVGVSYLGMVAPSWKLDEKFEVVNVPSNLTGKGFAINTGLFLGTFLF